MAERLYRRVGVEDRRGMVNLMREDASSAAVGLTFHAIETHSLDSDELAAAIDLAQAGSFRKSSGYLLELLTAYRVTTA